MARLPDVNIGDVSSQPVSDASVAPTDFGLGSVGSAISAFGQRQQTVDAYQVRADHEWAAGQVLKSGVMEDNEKGLTADAAAWNGTPGFAADQIAKHQTRAAAAIAGYDDSNSTQGQRDALKYAFDAEGQRVGQKAINIEAQTLAAQQHDAQTAQLNQLVTGYMQDYAARSTVTNNTISGRDPNYVGAKLADHDAAAAAAIANAPAQLQPALTASLSNQRVSVAAEALQHQSAVNQAFVQTASTNSINGLADVVLTDPTQYQSAVAKLEANVATLPPDARPAAKQAGMAQIATARVYGLSEQRQPQVAIDELESGKYDFLPLAQKQQLLTEAYNRLANPANDTWEEQVAARNAGTLASSMITAAATTGQVPGGLTKATNDLAQLLGTSVAADFNEKATAAIQFNTAHGAVTSQTTDQLRRFLGSPPPDQTTAEGLTQMPAWQAYHDAAQAELAAREQGAGAWAWGATKAQQNQKGLNGQVIRSSTANDLQTLWGNFASATNSNDMANAGSAYVNALYAKYSAAGVDKTAWQTLPDAVAKQLTAAAATGDPTQRAASVARLAAMFHALPGNVQAPDGSWVNPQLNFAAQLQKSGMDPMTVSALADFGNDPAKLGRYTHALLDPTAAAKIDKKTTDALTTAATAALQPFFAVSDALPNQFTLRQARIDRTVMVARDLMAQGMPQSQAVKSAAGDMTTGYTYTNGYRIPDAVAHTTSYSTATQTGLPDGSTVQTGSDAIRQGSRRAVQTLLANNGANLFAPDGPGNPSDRRAAYAAQVGTVGKLVSTPDDQGLALMVPSRTGGWSQVLDKYGRPVTMNWNQLKQSADPNQTSFPFMKPPPNAVSTGGGQMVGSLTTQQALSAVTRAVAVTESGGQNGLVSPKGAVGVMQVMPATAQAYLAKYGRTLDANRLQNDPNYNLQIGSGVLADNLQKYGSTVQGATLATIAYNAGPGVLDGYTDPKTGRHVPGWLTTIGDPRQPGGPPIDQFISRIPYPETRNYVQSVLPRILAAVKEPMPSAVDQAVRNTLLTREAHDAFVSNMSRTANAVRKSF